MCVISPVEFRNVAGYKVRLNLWAEGADIDEFVNTHVPLLKEYWDERGHKIYRQPKEAFFLDVTEFVWEWTKKQYIVCDIISPGDKLVGFIGGSFRRIPLCTAKRLAIDIIYLRREYRHPNIAEGTYDGLCELAAKLGADILTVSAEAHVGRGLERFWQAIPLTTVYFIGTKNGIN